MLTLLTLICPLITLICPLSTLVCRRIVVRCIHMSFTPARVCSMKRAESVVVSPQLVQIVWPRVIVDEGDNLGAGVSNTKVARPLPAYRYLPTVSCLPFSTYRYLPTVIYLPLLVDHWVVPGHPSFCILGRLRMHVLTRCYLGVRVCVLVDPSAVLECMHTARLSTLVTESYTHREDVSRVHRVPSQPSARFLDRITICVADYAGIV